MDLFKFLKKKRVDSFEELLKKAADEPSYRAEFQRRILTEKLLLLTNTQMAEGLVKLEAGTKINVFTLKEGLIPLFTSPERIYDKGILKKEMQYISASGEDIFTFLKGAKLILNPYSDYGKEFNPKEVQNLLDGRLTDLNEIRYDKATPIKIGQPAKYPTEIVKALIELFKTKPDVVAGYLGWFHDPATIDPPHYIFAIETIGDWRSLSDETGFVANQYMSDNEIFDLVQITHNGGFLNDYFTKQTKPFYTKSK